MLTEQFNQTLLSLYEIFTTKDASLIEINPLIVTVENTLLALDGKIDFDDNALYRHKDIIELRDTSQEDEKEKEAGEYQLNYISLDGTIGCMVNGAGLAMATMDLIEHHGGSPANFLDVGGGTTAQRVAKAFELIQTEANVGGVLVNIFGGIVRCDLIAEGILQAIEKVGLSLPIVVRLEGTNAQQGLALLSGSKYKCSQWCHLAKYNSVDIRWLLFLFHLLEKCHAIL
jgi:succinyl-CoA synthetase beta subunit